MDFIPYGQQNINQADLDAVLEVLQSDWLTQGPTIPAFEQELAAKCGVEHAVAVNSATSALHIAYLALGLGPGDLLWTSPNTFVATANAARLCKADVDFVDTCPETYNMSVTKLAEKLQQAAKIGKLPKIVVPVHFAGQSCDMAAIHRLAEQYDFNIVEDASHAVGGKYQDSAVGSCQYSDVTVFSFHPVKIITTAEGGVATTNSSELATAMRSFACHGVTRDAKQMTKEPDGPWYYQQLELGLNYRLTDLQAALGKSQLSRLDQFVAKRHQLVHRYDDLLANTPVITQFQAANTYSAHHLYVIQVENRRQCFVALREKDIGVNVHYIPVHLQPYYQKLGFKQGDFPNAEHYYERAISLPLFADLTTEQQDYVCDSVCEVVA